MADEGATRTIGDVGRENEEWVAKETAVSFDDAAECEALKRMLVGSSAEAMQEACSSVNQAAKWQATQQQWSAVNGTLPEALGARVRSVVESLEAPHLRPSGIEHRLNSGIAPACFGLFALMQHLTANADSDTQEALRDI